MTILVTGGNGQLGNELRVLLGNKPGVTSIVVDRDELDITDGTAVDAYIANHKPDYCINAAAYTNVEKAEDERDIAHAVNALGAENIARTCAKNNVILFHISTDFVFDGKKIIPYIEDDEPHPLSAYGQTKYEGELAVQELCPRSFIVRTSWLYSSFGSNFVKTMLRLCKERDSLPVVADQYGSPTYARDLAEALLKMIEYHMQEWGQVQILGSGSGTDFAGAKTEPDPKLSQTPFPFGIYHYVNDGEVTWFEFAQKIRDQAGLSCDLQPIPASDFPSKVIRPAYSVLSTKKIQRTFGVAVPEWDESLRDYIDMLRRQDS